MKVVGIPDSKVEALKSLELLRSKIESGEVIAFATVAIEPDDTCTAYVGCTRKITRLRIFGAVSWLLNGIINDG